MPKLRVQGKLLIESPELQALYGEVKNACLAFNKACADTRRCQLLLYKAQDRENEADNAWEQASERYHAAGGQIL